MDDETDLLVLAASAWTELMEYRYCFTYGYRKQLYEICLSFSGSIAFELFTFSGFSISFFIEKNIGSLLAIS